MKNEKCETRPSTYTESSSESSLALANNSLVWGKARSEMLLDPDVTNLNTGSFGPLPRTVFDRVTELRKRLAEEPMDFLLRQAPPLLWQAREQLATYLSGDARRLVFTANVTAAINLVAASLRLASPGEILLTDHEYGAMQWCWERAAQRQGLSIRFVALPRVPDTPSEITRVVRAAMTPRTRLFFFSHICSPTGIVLPARQLCEAARRQGVLTVVDGAHAPAQIPVCLAEIPCDFYAGNCHKWLLAPTGSGFLHFGPDSMERVRPLQVSWGWRHGAVDVDERDEFGSTPRLRALEFEGTRDPCPWLSVPAAIEFQARLDEALIRKRILGLSDYVRERLGLGLGFEAVTPDHCDLKAAMTAFVLPLGVDPVQLRRSLWEEFRIEVPIIERPGHSLIRVSTHFYNNEEEIDRLYQALQTLLA
jgi:isopenicillin-N epimerase